MSGGISGFAVSFPIQAPNGSVSAPSYSFEDHTGDGMFHDGTNVILAHTGAAVLEVKVGGIEVNGTSDLGTYAAIGDALALSTARTFSIGRNFTETTDVIASQLSVAGNITVSTSNNKEVRFADFNPGVTTLSTGNTHTFVTTATFDEPNIVEDTGVVTTAATIRISSVPTEGVNNYGLLVDTGDVRIDDDLLVAGNLDCEGYIAVGNGSALDQSFTLNINRPITLTTTADGAQVRIRGNITEATTGEHTTIAPLSLDAITITDGGGSETVINLATCYIAGSPIAGTTPTNGPFSIFVDSGPCRFDGDVEVRGFLNLGAGDAQTISGGVITAVSSFTIVDTEAAGSTDDLDTINGGTAGDELVITATSSARTIVAKDGTGNLKLAGDFSMDNDEDTLKLLFDGSDWLEMSRSNNGA